MNKKTFLVIDKGLYPHISEALSDEGKNRVLYATPWETKDPHFRDFVVGKGFGHLEKVMYPEDYYEKADCLIFWDVSGNALCNFLRKIYPNKSIVGAGLGERLENDRVLLKEWCKELGLDVSNYMVVKGVTALREHLKKNKDKYVKVNVWRGDLESFHSPDYDSIEQVIDEIAVKLGSDKEEFDFIVDDTIKDALEIGADTFFNGTEFIRPMFAGIEKHKNLYVAKVVDDIPILNETLEAFTPLLQKMNYRGPLSTEELVKSKTEHYWIDACLDDESEILTNEGWKLFKNLNKKELVATLNKDSHVIEYQKPIRYINKEHSEIMIGVGQGGDSIDIMMTPNHRVFGYKQNKNIPEFVTANNIPQGFRIPRTGIWEGKEEKCFMLPKYDNDWNSGRGNCPAVSCHKKALNILMDDWVAFMGMFLSEGSLQKNGVNIAQTKNVKEFKEIIDRLPFKYKYDGRAFRIGSTQLYLELKKFGKCNEKYIPDYIKNLSSRQIDIFLKYFCLGDGHLKDGKHRQYFSTSKRMIDDIQELIFKIGKVGNICNDRATGTIMSVHGGKTYTRNFDCYRLQERNGQTQFNVDQSRYNHIKEYKYTGRVYCVEVPNGIIYVRRNGKPYWISNCMRLPNPLSALYPVMIENWSEFIYEIGLGHYVEPEIKHKNVGAFGLSSLAAKDSYVKVNIKKGYEDKVRYQMVTGRGDKNYAVPGWEVVAILVAGGNTVDEVLDGLKEAAEGVDAHFLDKDPLEGIHMIIEDIKKAEKLGIM